MTYLNELFGDLECNSQAIPNTQAELSDGESEAQMPSNSEALSPIINTQPYYRMACISEAEPPAQSVSNTSTFAISLSNSMSPTLQHSVNVSEAANGEATQFGTCQHCGQP